jgi:hypothetical protein
MTSSASRLTGLLFYLLGSLALLSPSAALSEEQALTRSRVLLELDLPEGVPAEKEQSRALNRLIDRIMAIDDLALEQEDASATAVVAGQRPEGIYVDVGGLGCQQASLLVESKVLNHDEIEIGLVGAKPLLRSWDVENAVRTKEGHLILLLRPEGAKRFRDLTAHHIGEPVYIQLGGDGHREVISIGAVIDSGRVQVRQENVPADFALRTILGYPARVAGCTERK